MNCDSKQAISFQEDTCPKSRIRGSFDLREDWVAEVRDWSEESPDVLDSWREELLGYHDQVHAYLEVSSDV